MPDPDRIGGETWFLSTTADERLAYYRGRCADRSPESREDLDDEACAIRSIRAKALDVCIYYETPRWVENGPTEAERLAGRVQCQNKVLGQHGLPLL